MKIFISAILLFNAFNVQTMDAPPQSGKEEKKDKERLSHKQSAPATPRRDDKDKHEKDRVAYDTHKESVAPVASRHDDKDEKEKKGLFGSIRRSSKNLIFKNDSPAHSPQDSPSSSFIVSRTSSQSPSPQGSQIDSRRGSILRTLTAFNMSSSVEQGLDEKLQKALEIKNNRSIRDDLLREIVEAKVDIASTARFQAAQLLFESGKEDVKLGFENVKKFKLKNNIPGLKGACNEILTARECAIYAVGKRLCAVNPNKFEVWCRHETFMDKGLKELNQSLKTFFHEQEINDDMKKKDFLEEPLPNAALEKLLKSKLEHAITKKHDRYEYENLLQEILVAKIMTYSPSKRAAAQALFVSETEQIKIGFANVSEWEQNKSVTDKKTEFTKILKALEMAYFAVGKRICAETPLKSDQWCRFETDIDEPLIRLHQEVDDFMARNKVTEELKTKDAHVPLDAP